MGKFHLGDRYDWRGEKHGPWRRGTGGLANRPVRQQPVRFNSGPTPRHAVMDFIRLIQEYPEVWDQI